MNEDAARRMVRELWLKHRSLTLERLAVVQSALDQLVAGSLAPDARVEALSEAHKLRGILGTYGFADGSDVVAEAEEVLGQPGDTGAAVGVSARLAACVRSLADA
jgi:HPt (histidine-containing phosphotransfer) domain-containing protein